MTIPVIDAHHHIWRQVDLPWLEVRWCRASSDPTSRSAATIRSTEYLADIAGSGVEKSVYVQANWAPERAEDEVAWVQTTADETGWPHAIVGYANFMGEDVRPGSRPAEEVSAAPRHPHAASLARKRAIPLRAMA